MKNDEYEILTRRRAFTLIELLVVIAIIAILAAFLLPAASAVKRHSLIQHAQTEMAQLETAIERYKSAYGFYPPGNGNAGNSLTNQLYYELSGTYTNNSGYVTLDGSSTIALSSVNPIFGVGGFFNTGFTNNNNSGEDIKTAQNFLPDLKGGQIATNSAGVAVIVTSVNGSDQTYQPMPGFISLSGSSANPWRYVYPGVNNPNSYDLWVQLWIGGKTNLVCNWSKQVQINNPLP